MPTTKKFWIAILCCIYTLTACTTMQPLPDSMQAWRESLKAGDEIELVLNSGQHIPMKITNIDGSGIEGLNHRYQYSDISNIAKKQIDKTRTTLLILGIVAVGAAASSGGGGGSSGGGGGY